MNYDQKVKKRVAYRWAIFFLI